MTTLDRSALLAALDAIEEADARHIAWGLIDESWTRDGLVEFLREHWGGPDTEACIDELLAENLLVQLPREWPARYRTRMSESVRLFARLRQLFPGKPWQSGSRLVSDFRFLRRPRAFPERDFKPAEVPKLLQGREIPVAVLSQVGRVLAGRSLSRFQLAATAEIFSALRSKRDRGVVVGAGTGSGKTLAFYLPALSQLAAAATGSRLIAIYPRNELLKDQLVTALQEVRSLRSSGSRLLTIGAYFGPTPFSSDGEPDRRGGWRKDGSSWLCPFLTCPATNGGINCGGALAWVRPPGRPASPVDWGHLTCQTCGGQVTSDELRLTRTAMQKQVPDILFTTTEMLNQQLSDGWSRHVFGVGQGQAPDLVLLDEIHTYSGTSGAQVAYLLRRWRKLMSRPVTWVGLSATLANAAAFFADLCGLSPESIADVRPDPDAMKRKGSEYQLLLRGDPASQAALLSTSIQSLMLLRRILDENGVSPGGPYGTRVFAFLENLDLVNRLYRQVLNAEGRDPFGNPDRQGHVLASLRIPDDAARYAGISDEAEWDREGQFWWLPDKLGFATRSLQISRTSSQDTGVSQSTDIVIATSSLEVGYDDPRVGAILQHKAPRDIAQFLQRRGRAGRVQDQRPWTVVVLSDYGRDRLAFQSYETIIDPSVPAKNLPLGNQSVRKMQAAMCLIDWIAVRLGVDGSQRWSVRRILSKPGEKSGLVQACQQLLVEVLEGGAAQQDLFAFVQSSLSLSREETQSICWEYPRSLMLEVVPTAYRRLTSNWSTVQSREVVPGTDIVARQPLPEFIPSTLFSDLALPEVEIVPPPNYDPAAETSMPVGMALSELAPGKVTLRWAVQKVRGLWIEAPAYGVLDLDAGLASGGEVITNVSTPDGPVPVVRPVVIRPTVPPPHVQATSNGWLKWRFAIDDDEEGTQLPRPRNNPLGQLVPEVTAFLNADRGPLQTWRFALEGTAEVVMPGTRRRQNLTFTRRERRAAVGFASTIDALLVTVAVPQSLAAFKLDTDPGRLRQLRTDRFAHLTREGLEQSGLGPFTAAWVTDVVLSVAADAVLRGDGIDSLLGLGPQQWQSLAASVVDGVLLATNHTEVDETPLRDTVLDALQNSDTIQVLEETIPTLNEKPDQTWLPWIRSRFMHTLAAAWQAAVQQVCPDFNVDADALVDILDEGGPRARIVMSDTVPGGGGLIEALTRRLADDPRRFDALVAAAVEPSDSEEVDPSLRRVLELLATSAPVRDAAQRFRAGVADRLQAWQDLNACLAEEGIPQTHANLTALSTRIFRPGSGAESDDLLRLALDRWDDIDVRAGFAIDHRAICAFLAKDDQVLDKLRRVAAPTNEADSQTRAQLVLLSLLWTRAYARRPETLRATNRFIQNPLATERTLLRDVLPTRPAGVDVDSEEWRDALASALRTRGTARLVSSSGRTSVLARAVRELMVDPLELDWLHVYPQMEGIIREDGRYSVSVSLREAPQ
ncbi:protein DpdJ [Nonomuraea guangzhouensis]|uniref:Protein DpdJ n=1 Tax=Nonomuraea guangzhouensis TaxID=1291555 RepID=A0ABW4GXX8_9ACTN|nr:protein DpdJ [Nonomuraea guangzhouensis]